MRCRAALGCVESRSIAPTVRFGAGGGHLIRDCKSELMSITRDLLAFRSIPPLDADFTATTVGTARRLGITSPSPMPALTDEVIE